MSLDLRGMSREDLSLAQKSAQKTFIESRVQYPYDRGHLEEEIKEYCTSDSSRTPLLVVGEEGSGKSSLIAKCVKDALRFTSPNLSEVPDIEDRWCMFYHFVGATPISTDLGSILQHLLRETKSGEKESIKTLEETIQQTHRSLSTEKSSRILVFIDAINQVCEDQQHLLDRWLPQQLAPNIRVVVSTIEGSASHATLRTYKPSLKEVVCGAIGDECKKNIILDTFESFNMRLEGDHIKILIRKVGSRNPLWLTLTCEQLLVHETPDMMGQAIKELPDDLINLVMNVLTRLENQCGGHLLKCALCLLEVSRYGLFKKELEKLLANQILLEHLSFKEERAISLLTEQKLNIRTIEIESEIRKSSPTGIVDKDCLYKENENSNNGPQSLPLEVKLKELFHAVKPFLRPYADLSEGRLKFYHQSISKAVQQKYFSEDGRPSKTQCNYWRGILADYFESVSDDDRRAEELPYQLVHLSDDKRLSTCLLDWSIFNRLYDKSFSKDLLRLWDIGGGLEIAASKYADSLAVLEQSGLSDDEFTDQAQKVALFLIQAGQYERGNFTLEKCISHSMDNPAKLADVYASMAHCRSVHLNTIAAGMNYVEEMEERKKVVDLCMTSNEYRGKVEGEDQEYSPASNNIVLSYNLFRSGDKEKALAVINEAISVFEKLNDDGMLARSLIRRSFLVSEFDVKKSERLKARELCIKAYGKSHELYGNICFSLGELYLYHYKEHEQAYNYFIESEEVYEKVYGPSHPETIQVRRRIETKVFDNVRRQRERLSSATA